MPGLKIGIDLGTNSITAFVAGKGIVFREETALCIDTVNGEVVAVGNAAAVMQEKTPDGLVVKRPMSGGVISDFSVMAYILSHFVAKLCKGQIFKPEIVISTPAGVTALERKTIVEAACTAGASKVSLVDEPVISALGAGLSIDKPHGVMVIDLGAGTTDISVITMGVSAFCRSLKTAGDTMDEAICQYIKREAEAVIGLTTARKIKHVLGCAYPRSEEVEMTFTGKDPVTSQPKNYTVTSTQIYTCLTEQINAIFLGIMEVLEEVPPELYSDICTEGILLTGGGALMPGIDTVLSERLGIAVRRAVDPIHCAAKGAGYVLQNMATLEDHGYSFRAKEISLN